MNHCRSLLLAILFAFTPTMLSASDPVPAAMTEADRINLERNLRWMIERERRGLSSSSKPRVGVYADAGVWHVGAKSIVELLEAEGVPCRVLDRTRLAAPELNDLETLILPGGWAPLQWGSAGEKGLEAIKQFVNRGGRCIGICAGAYLLSHTVRYDDKEFLYPVGLFDGAAVGPVPNHAAFPKPGSAKLKVTDAGKVRGLVSLNEHDVYYSGGPCFVGGTGVTVLAEYPNSSAAAISRTVGKGEIILLGGHIERPVPPLGDDAAAPKYAGAILKSLVQTRSAEQADTFRIIGYLPEYRIATYDIDQAKHLSDLIYFAVSPSETGDAGIGRIKPETIKLLKKIRETHGVRIHLCLGGWNRSKGFAALSASAEARKKLATQLVPFCTEHGFAGVDVDWEHPANAAERTNHGKLMAELKAAFEPHKLKLSMAVAGWQEMDPVAIRAVDTVHLMAYDARGQHSTFEFAKSDLERIVKKGVPYEKIALGVPFYGRNIKKPDDTRTYREIWNKDHPKPDVDEIDGVYFNGRDTIEKKIKLAKEKNLAGIMIWEVGQDAPGNVGLLPFIRQTVGKKN